MVSGGNDSYVKVWSVSSSAQTGAELKLIHSVNVNVKVNDVTFGPGNNIVLATTEQNKLLQEFGVEDFF